ncbi:MAG: peptidoglycan DD-metalloendopeptidase family protein [Rikenellaceae bacterium]
MLRTILISLFLLIASSITAQSVSEQTKRKQQIEEEIAFLDKQLASTKSKQQANTKELNFIQRKITNRKKLLKELEEEINFIDSQVVKKEQEIAKLNNDLANLKKSYSDLIYLSYKKRNQTIWFMYILASNNVEQGYRRWSYIKNYSQAIKDMAGDIRNSSEKITTERETLAKIKANSLNVQAKKQLEFKKLSQEEMSAKRAITQLTKKEKEVKQQLDEKRKEIERLNKEIERILAAAVKEKKRPDYKESVADRALSDKFENNRGRLPWPVKRGVVIEQFGQHYHPVFKNIKLPFNNGVNIATDANADVLCVFDGVVKQMLVMPGYNQCILIQHGNFFTFYTKLDKISVKSGDKVSTGQVLGSLIESDGNSVIHFQLWKGTEKQDPEQWISR